MAIGRHNPCKVSISLAMKTIYYYYYCQFFTIHSVSGFKELWKAIRDKGLQGLLKPLYIKGKIRISIYNFIYNNDFIFYSSGSRFVQIQYIEINCNLVYGKPLIKHSLVYTSAWYVNIACSVCHRPLK